MQQETVLPKNAKLTLSDFEETLHPVKKTSALGKGSYGIVKLVREKGNPKSPLYALKAINKKLVAESGASGILNREIRIHQKLEHPHVIKLHYAFEDAQNLYLILDYAENGSLFHYLRKKKKFTEKEAFIFFFQTALGIDYLHKKNILHRDLKPENLLLDRKGNIKVCDFGWSAEDSDSRNTFCGTIDYMAPEMVDRKNHDYRVDIWSLGILLYELLHGHEPFRAKTPNQKFKQILNNDFKINPEISPLAQDLIQKLLRADPEERLNFEQIFEHGWLKKYEQELKINIRKYIYDSSKRVKSTKDETMKPTRSRTREADDADDTSLNVSVVDFEPVSLKNHKMGLVVCKSENTLPESSDFDLQVSQTAVTNSKSLIMIPNSPKSNSKRSHSQNSVTPKKDTILDEDLKTAEEIITPTLKVLTLTDLRDRSPDLSNNEGLANNNSHLSTTPLKKSKSIFTENEKMISDIQQMIKATETKEHARNKSENILSSRKPASQNTNNRATPETSCPLNSKTLDEIPGHHQIENRETNEKVRLTDIDKYFDDLLDSKDETFQVLSKVEAVSKTSLENETRGKSRQNKFKDTESKTDRSDNSDNTGQGRNQNDVTSRKSTTSIEMHCHQEISEIDLNLSRMDEPLSDEVKSMIGSTPPKSSSKLAVERGFTFGGKPSHGSSNCKSIPTPVFTEASKEKAQSNESKQVESKVNALKKELMSESSEHDDESEADSHHTNVKQSNAKAPAKNMNYKISEKGSELEQSPEAIAKTTDLQKEQLQNYYKHEMKKLQSAYDEELSRIEALVLENESPSTDSSKFSQSSRLKQKAQALSSRKRFLLEDSSSESPQLEQRSKFSKKGEKISSTVKDKIVEDPDQLHHWLSNRRPVKDMDLSFLPKQYVYGQKQLDSSSDILYKTAQKLEELSKKDFKHQPPRQSVQKLGLVDRFINMLTCGNKRHC